MSYTLNQAIGTTPHTIPLLYKMKYKLSYAEYFHNILPASSAKQHLEFLEGQPST